MTHDLIDRLFMKHFHNEILSAKTDSAVLSIGRQDLAFTTDSYVVDPVFFPGGNIGKLAVCGTVNDLAVSGAVPLYLTASFIIEEGFPMADLETIVRTMKAEADEAGVRIVTGDTKVVDRGKCDKVFINTAGIGSLRPEFRHISSGGEARPGDKIIVNGTLGDHGMAILSARNGLGLSSGIRSDCASLNRMIQDVLTELPAVLFMRDATRGGVAGVLCEFAAEREFGLSIDETLVPIGDDVRGMCELLGFDPLFTANEGKVVMVVENGREDKVLEILRRHPQGGNARVIGEVVETPPGKVILETEIGGKRMVDMPAGEQLPRIC
jgi:hydrogenase expression/formation protein HypE